MIINLGFQKGQGTIDQIFPARQLREKCQKENFVRYGILFDQTEGFDSLGRDGIYKVIPKFGCTGKVITTLKLFRENLLARFKMIEFEKLF